MGRPKKSATNNAENAMVRALDQLAGYENYRRDVAPHIRKLMESGASAQKILDSAKELAAVKLVEKALGGTGKDQMVALKELLDRTEGKATEKIEIKNKYDRLGDDELDALLASKLKELKDVGPIKG